MKINGQGQVAYADPELMHRVRMDPAQMLGGVRGQQPQQHNRAIDQMYSDLSKLASWTDSDTDIAWHQQQQTTWLMPVEYQQLDIAALLLSLCDGDAELQRMAIELMMFQDRDLMMMLNYLHYLVQTLRSAEVVLGVGRGSSVASFALFKLGVHRVNSLYWDLDIAEFLK